MSKENKVVELKNEDLKNTSGGGSRNCMISAVMKVESNDSFCDGVFLYVVTSINMHSGNIMCDKYEIDNGKYVFMSPRNRLTVNELLEMEYMGKFNG